MTIDNMFTRHRNTARTLASFVFIGGIITSVLFVLYETGEHRHLQSLAALDPASHYRELIVEARTYMSHIVLMVVMGAVCSLGLLMLYSINRSQLSDSLGQLRRKAQAMEAAREGIAMSDRDGAYTYVNQAFARMFGFSSPAELIGQSWTMLYTPEEVEHLQRIATPLLEHDGVWRGRITGLRKDGTSVPLEITSTRFDDGYISIMQDMTEKLRAQEEYETLLSAINLAEDGIAIFAEDDTLLYANAAVFKILGPLGLDSLAPASRMLLTAELALSRQRKGYKATEETCELESGRRVTIALSMSSYRDGIVLAIMRDVSTQKRAEDEMESLRHQFYQAQKMEAIGRMAGGMAHDFNNMLAAIMGNAEFLLEDLPADSPERAFAHKIHDASLEARDMIDQILTYSRRHDVPNDQFDLGAAVQETRGIVEGILPPAVELQWQCDDAKMPVLGNASQIKQCLINLCSNAADALPGGKGIITVTATGVDHAHPYYLHFINREVDARVLDIVESRDDDRLHAFIGAVQEGKPHVMLSVADTGTGIDRDVLEHIFEPFFTTKPVHEGTGLGLSAVQGIVLNHHGAAVVDTRPGEGTTISLLLPATSPVISAVEKSEARSGAVGQGTVFVIDDQTRVLEITENLVQRLGYTVKSFSDPFAMIDAVKTTPDILCVITDQSMPAMTGIELAERLWGLQPDLPVIIISGHDTQSVEARRATLPNIAGVMKKPVERVALAALLDGMTSPQDRRQQSI